MVGSLLKIKFGINSDIVNGDVPNTSNFMDTKLTRQKMVDKFQSVNGFNIIFFVRLSVIMIMIRIITIFGRGTVSIGLSDYMTLITL